MVTATGTPFTKPSATAPCHLQVIATKQHKNIIMTGQEIKTHKTKKYFTSSDPLLQY